MFFYKWLCCIFFVMFSLTALCKEIESEPLHAAVDQFFSNVKGGVIRGVGSPSTGQVRNEILLFSNENDALAIETLITGLTSHQQLYLDLGFDEWSLVSERLMKIDSLISEDVYWGNLTLKFFVQDYIAFSIYSRVSQHPSEAGRYAPYVRVLRVRSPTKIAALKIALQHYGVSDGSLRVLGLGLGKDSGSIGKAAIELNAKYASAKKSIRSNKELEDLLTQKYQQEQGLTINTFVDLLRREPVLKVALDSDYQAMLSELSMFVCYKSHIINEDMAPHEWFESVVRKCSSSDDEIFRSYELRSYLSAKNKSEHPYMKAMLASEGRHNLDVVWSDRSFFPHSLLGN